MSGVRERLVGAGVKGAGDCGVIKVHSLMQESVLCSKLRFTGVPRS